MIVWLLLGLLSAAALLVAWIVYPAITIAAGERRQGGPDAPSQVPELVSVLIATRDAPAAVRTRLDDILSGEYPAGRLELVVAIDGDPGPYGFDGLAPAPHRVVVVPGDAPGGKASALNAGVRAASGDILICTDTHQRFAPDAIPRLVSAMNDPALGAVSGALSIGNEREGTSPLARYWQMERRLRAAEARLHSTIGVSGSIYAIRRALWSPLPGGLILDDLWIPMRLILNGYRVGFEPRAAAADTRITTTDQEFRRKVRTLTGNLQLVTWLPALLLPWRNPVWIPFVCHKLLRLATPFALAGLAAASLGMAFSISAQTGVGLSAAGLAAAGAILVWPGAAGARLRHALSWVLAMQGAVLVATWNGIRGNWDVWSGAPIRPAPPETLRSAGRVSR